MGGGVSELCYKKILTPYNMIFIYFFKIFLPISQSFLLNPEKVYKKLISDNANFTRGGGLSKC